ncbi:MAG: hypothetical protein ACREIR_09560 [Geminicoccaceae bacterium]
MVAIEGPRAEWPILDQEQWHGLLAAAITKELVAAGFGREFSEDEAENFLCAPTVAYLDTHRSSGTLLYDVVQIITEHAVPVEDCIRPATLYAECYVKANHAELSRR